MATISMKYFKDHVPSSHFDNQVVLAISLTAHGKRSIIESDEINPLTVRLFNIKNALGRVEDCISRLTPLSFPVIFSQQGYYNGQPKPAQLYGTVAPSGSMEYVHSYLTDRKDWKQDPFSITGVHNYRFEQADSSQIRIINDDTITHTFHLHSGVYDFFTNLDSSVDRIRLELNSIYFDGMKVLDSSQSRGNRYWANYLDSRNGAIRSMSSNGYNAIVSILTGALSVSLDKKTSKYRNRLIHDGDLEIQIDKSTGRVFLPDDPLATPLIFATELLPHLRTVFSDLQELLKHIYTQVIVDVKSRNALPLI